MTDRERAVSASEKLRALYESAYVAVIEAAEDTEYATDPEWPLHAALAALTEALP